MPRHCATRPRWRRRNCCWWRPTRRSSPRCHTGASRTGRPWPPTPCGRWPLSSSCRSARCARSSPQPVSGCSAAGEQRGERLMDRAAGAALLGPAEIREIAERLGVRPSKRLGQNFVVDPGTVRRIVALAGLAPDDMVLEVGPGFGSLTLGLLGAAGRVIAVEMDPVLAAELLLVETDAPFLTPVPHRGKPNRPALAAYTVRALAALKQLPVGQMCAQLTATGERV